MSLTLGLDLGTTSICAVAVRDTGDLAAVVRVPNDAALSHLPAGHAEQSPARLWELSRLALRQLSTQLSRSDPPVCLGLTGQMHGTLLVDAQRQPLSNLITWQDRRALQPCPGTTRTFLDELLQRSGEAVLHPTGCRLAAGYLGTTLFTLRQQKRLPQTGAQASFLIDWISSQLREGDLITDPSNAASSGIFDLPHRRWSDELVALLDVSREWLPEVRESGVVLGHLAPAVAEETGLPRGLPVCNAIGDNQAAVLGSVPAGDPAIQINVGTGGQINWPVAEFVRLPGMDTRYLPLGRYMLVGAGLSGGDAYAWVNRTAARWLKGFGIELSSDEIYARMNALAAEIPQHNDGLTCDPLFRGTRQKPQARGEIHGITFDNFSLGHVARAVVQGIARGMHWFYENAGSSQPAHLSRIIGSGNGLRNNRLLVEALSQQFARPIVFPQHQEEAAYGTALLAGVQTGLWPDLVTAGMCIHLVPA